MSQLVYDESWKTIASHVSSSEKVAYLCTDLFLPEFRAVFTGQSSFYDVSCHNLGDRKYCSTKREYCELIANNERRQWLMNHFLTNNLEKQFIRDVYVGVEKNMFFFLKWYFYKLSFLMLKELQIFGRIKGIYSGVPEFSRIFLLY